MYFPNERDRVALRLPFLQKQIVSSMRQLLEVAESTKEHDDILCSILLSVPRKDFIFAPYRINFHNTGVRLFNSCAPCPIIYHIFTHYENRFKDDVRCDQAIVTHLCEAGFHMPKAVDGDELYRL